MQFSKVNVLIFALSVGLYCNTWSAHFAFDDNFAVVSLGLLITERQTQNLHDLGFLTL